MKMDPATPATPATPYAAPYATSTRTYVVYSSCISPIDLNDAFKRAQEYRLMDGEILSIKYGQNNEATSCLKCLTISVKTNELITEKVEKSSNPSKRGRKATKQKVEGKLLSVKLFRNGSTQVTGCKTIDHVKFSMNMVYLLLGLESVPELNVVSIMNNINFSIGFKIDREKLGIYLTEQGINVPPITTGYMGIKIRIQSLVDKNDLTVPRLSWSINEGFNDLTSIPYVEFFAHDLKKIEKNFTTCIGIFQNGKILMTCIDDFTTGIMFKHVFELLNKARSFIEIQERTTKTFKR